MAKLPAYIPVLICDGRSVIMSERTTIDLLCDEAKTYEPQDPLNEMMGEAKVTHNIDDIIKEVRSWT